MILTTTKRIFDLKGEYSPFSSAVTSLICGIAIWLMITSLHPGVGILRREEILFRKVPVFLSQDFLNKSLSNIHNYTLFLSVWCLLGGGAAFVHVTGRRIF